MSFFRNSQIAKMYDVSPTTVTNWILASKKGLNDLELVTIGKRKVLVDSDFNRNLISKLKSKGKKHIGRDFVKTCEVNPKLYEVFNDKQLSEIYCSLSTKLEIPYKFTYIDKGADLWDLSYKAIYNGPEDALNNDAIKEENLLVNNLDSYLTKLKKYKKIHIIDVGCGNGEPAIKILNQLFEDNFEVEYTAVDISKRMIEIDKDILLSKFPKMKHNTKVIDMDKENLSDVTVTTKSEDTVNLILFLGSTLGNYTKDTIILRQLYNSMSSGDLLMIGTALAHEDDNMSSYKPNQYHFNRTVWILDYLGFEDCYDKNSLTVVEPEKLRETRKVNILKNVRTEIKIFGNTLPLELKEFDDILVYKFSWYTELELVEEVVKQGFRIEHFTTNRERNYGLMLLGV